MKNGANKEREYVVSGDRLRGCRKAIGVTQQTLAEMVQNLPESSREDCSFKTIGKMERGEVAISAEYAYLLSQIFGCNPQWLRGHSNIKTKEERDNLSKDKVNGLWQTNRGKQSGDIGIVVGGNIKRLRAMRGMTTERLAEATGIPVDKINGYEENAATATTEELDKICKELNAKAAMLYGQLPLPEDMAQWRIEFLNGDFASGPIEFVVSRILERLNSSGHEAALCMLRGLVETPRFQRQRNEVRGNG